MTKSVLVALILLTSLNASAGETIEPIGHLAKATVWTRSFVIEGGFKTEASDEDTLAMRRQIKGKSQLERTDCSLTVQVTDEHSKLTAYQYSLKTEGVTVNPKLLMGGYKSKSILVEQSAHVSGDGDIMIHNRSSENQLTRKGQTLRIRRGKTGAIAEAVGTTFDGQSVSCLF